MSLLHILPIIIFSVWHIFLWPLLSSYSKLISFSDTTEEYVPQLDILKVISIYSGLNFSSSKKLLLRYVS